jgi:hypothetical protein
MDSTIAVAIIGGIFTTVVAFIGGKKFQETKTGVGLLKEVQDVYKSIVDDIKSQNIKLTQDLGNLIRINSELENNNRALSNQINALKNELHLMKIEFEKVKANNDFYRSNFCQKLDCPNRKVG